MKNNNVIIQAILGLVLTLIISYVTFSFVQQYVQEGISYGQALFDLEGKIQVFNGLPYELKFTVIAFVVGIFALLIGVVRKKDKGYKDASNHGAYGSAQFSNLEKLRAAGYIALKKHSKWSKKNPYVALSASEGIMLGRVEDELVIIPPESKLDNRNVLLIGASGSGKGQAFVINNILNNKSSTIVVTDPKGELYDLTHEIKRDQGYKVYQIDFLNLLGDGYNPLDYIHDDLDAKRIALTIARNASKDDKEDHWFSKAVDLLTGLILYVKDKYPNPSIPIEVKREFNKAYEDEEYLVNVCIEIGEDHAAYQYLKDASVAKGNERTSIFSTFTKQVGIFSSKKVADLTKQSDINFHDLQEEVSILYIKIPIKDNPVASLTATFFDQLITTLYKIGDQYGSKLKIPTILLLDEFANIGKLNGYDETLSTCRGYDLSLITVVQDFAQLEAKYGKEIARTIINNHDTTLFLRTKDPETAKFFERLAGDTTIRYNTKSTSNGGGWAYILDVGGNSGSSSVSQNEQLIKKPLVSEAEFLNINPPSVCYAFLTGHTLKMEKAYQSLIYKGFITGEKQEIVDGIKRFPYVYPQHQDRYLQTIGKKPAAHEKKIDISLSKVPEAPVTVDIKKTQDNIEVDGKTASDANTKESELIERFVSNAHIPPTKEKPKAKEKKPDLMDSLVSQFVTEIISGKPEETTSYVEAASDSESVVSDVQPIEDVQEQLNEVVENAKEAFNDNPSTEALAELKGIITFKQTVEEVEELLEENEQLEEVVSFFEGPNPLDELIELDSDTDIDLVEIEEELPM